MNGAAACGLGLGLTTNFSPYTACLSPDDLFAHKVQSSQLTTRSIIAPKLLELYVSSWDLRIYNYTVISLVAMFGFCQRIGECHDTCVQLS